MQKNSALATITVSPARSRRASDKCDEHAAPHCLHRMQQKGLRVQLVTATLLVVYRQGFRSPRSSAGVD
jgi:hypothetical protein